MSDVMTAKSNSGFIMRPYAFFHGDRTRSETKVLGYVYGMTRKEGQVCRFGYSSLAEKLGFSRSTAARSVRNLRDAGEIEMRRMGGQKSVYTYKGIVPEPSHVQTELWLYSATFCINGVERRLTNAAIDVYSLILAHTRDEKSKCFTGSIRQIAGVLGIAEKTVERVIPDLFEADLIIRTAMGVNGNQKSVFKANLKKVKTERKKAKKEERAKERVQAQLPQHVIDANAKAAREKFYADLRARCLAQADRYQKKAESAPRYITVERELGAMNISLAKAELNTPELLPMLQAKQRSLQDERAEILRRLGIEEWQLDADNFAECQECHDTGFRKSDDRACGCYRCRS